MSRMTKTQVQHLKTRLDAALTSKANIKFKRVESLKISTEMKTKKIQEICDLLGLDSEDVDLYYISNLAMQLLRKDCGAKEKNIKIDADKREYINKYQIKIEEILDEAILGDSEEALKALKDFKESL